MANTYICEFHCPGNKSLLPGVNIDPWQSQPCVDINSRQSQPRIDNNPWLHT